MLGSSCKSLFAIQSHAYICPICGPVSKLLADHIEGEAPPDAAIKEQIAQLHFTRQVSESQKFHAGSLINDISGNEDGMGGMEMSSTAGSGLSDDSGMVFAPNCDAVACVPIDTTAIAVSVVDSFENDPDNDGTLNQMVSMELDQRAGLTDHEESLISGNKIAREALTPSFDPMEEINQAHSRQEAIRNRLKRLSPGDSPIKKSVDNNQIEASNIQTPGASESNNAPHRHLNIAPTHRSPLPINANLPAPRAVANAVERPRRNSLDKLIDFLILALMGAIMAIIFRIILRGASSYNNH